jgi:hypothetical protein
MDLNGITLCVSLYVFIEGVQLEDCHLLASGTQWRSMAVEGTRHKVHNHTDRHTDTLILNGKLFIYIHLCISHPSRSGPFLFY